MVAKPTKMTVIKSANKKVFVKAFNSSLPTKEFRESCKKAGSLLERSKKA